MLLEEDVCYDQYILFAKFYFYDSESVLNGKHTILSAHYIPRISKLKIQIKLGTVLGGRGIFNRLKLKKVGKTTRPLRYDLNQIHYDYTVEVRNRFKGLDLIDRVPDGQRFIKITCWS